MRTVVRLAQLVTALLLVLCLIEAISQGCALIWLLKMQLVGGLTTALLRYMRVVYDKPTAHEYDTWYEVLFACYKQEWRIELGSWRALCDDDVVALAYTVLGMAWRQLVSPVALVETCITGECPEGW